jgi:hypothetical protein
VEVRPVEVEEGPEEEEVEIVFVCHFGCGKVNKEVQGEPTYNKYLKKLVDRTADPTSILCTRHPTEYASYWDAFEQRFGCSGNALCARASELTHPIDRKEVEKITELLI